jgi:monofunctional biosynthetic peptidoglycan transglycosylase
MDNKRLVYRRKGYFSWLFSSLIILIIAVALSTFLIVLAYRWVNPSLTWLMVDRYIKGEKTRLNPIRQTWVSIDDISQHMYQAVVAAEDNLFMSHYGFDFKQIEDARKERERGIRVRGASTISMQVSKNVFLWHGRTWTRKVLEAGFTLTIETLWSKKRIMEAYLNIAEFGPSIYGVEEASQQYFKKEAKKLTRSEAAMLTTVLPNPLRRNPAKPSQYMRTYQQRVLQNMQNIEKVIFDVDNTRKNKKPN